MKTKKIFLILLLLFITTGCTKRLSDTNNEVVKNDETGQILIQNILCKPENETTIEAYEKAFEEGKVDLQNKLDTNEITQAEYDTKTSELVNIENLPSCEEITLSTGNYEGLWTNLFVKPLAFLIMKISSIFKNTGVAVIIVTLLIRLCLYPVTIKAAKQSEQMKKVKPEMEKIEKKYKDKKDQQSMMQKSQETMKLYKENNINPVSGCIFAIIQIPLFFAFYESINRLPAIFEEQFLGLNLGKTVLTALQNGQFYYIIVSALVILVTYYSFKLNQTAQLTQPGQEQMINMKTMMRVMIVMISITSFTVSTGIAIYWITNSSFTIIQNLIVKRSK